VLARLEEHADLEASAREYGALRRVRAVRSGAQLMRLVLVYVLSGLSLSGTAAWAEASGEVSLSDVALLKRLRGCGPWLAKYEPLRVCRRLQLLRGWSYDKANLSEIFTGSARACRADGA
jgi:hypothetical protein